MINDDIPVARPNSSIIDAVDSMIDRMEMRWSDIDKLKLEVAQLNELVAKRRQEIGSIQDEIQKEARKIAEIEDPAEQIAVAKFLYNKRPHVTACTLISAVFNLNKEQAEASKWRAKLLEKLGPVAWGPCAVDGCRSMVPIMTLRGLGQRRTCKDCVNSRRELEAQRRERDIAFDKEFQRRLIAREEKLDAVVDLLGLSDEDLREIVVTGHDRLFASKVFD